MRGQTEVRRRKTQKLNFRLVRNVMYVLFTEAPQEREPTDLLRSYYW